LKDELAEVKMRKVIKLFKNMFKNCYLFNGCTNIVCTKIL